MSDTGLILLAAGGSKRMGRPKQLLRIEGQTVIRRAAETALASMCSPIVMVLGADISEIQPQLQGLPIQIVENPQWRHGMAFTIHVGLEVLLRSQPNIEAVILMLCDQPLLTAEVLNQLVEARAKTECLLAASVYDNTLGVPALFHNSVFPELLALQGDEGARRILSRHSQKVARLPFPGGEIDLDTTEDLENYLMASASEI